MAGALLLFGALALAPESAWAQETQQVANAPDFSAVTTTAAAIRLARRGELVRIRPFPAELGGPSDPENIVYIPPAVEEARQRLIGTLRRFTDQDLIDQLDVRAKYKGDSIVPSRLHYTARHSRGGPPFEATIEVW
jgi:hypothetical protein